MADLENLLTRAATTFNESLMCSCRRQKAQKPGVGLPIATPSTTQRRRDPVVGHGLCDGFGRGALRRQGDRRNGVIATVAGLFCLRRLGGDGSLLLFVHDDRVVVGPGRASLCADASATARGLSARMTLGEVRSPHRLDQATATDVDGPSDLWRDSRDVGDARDSLPRRAAGLSQPDDHHRDHLDRCRGIFPRRHRQVIRFSLELGTRY